MNEIGFIGTGNMGGALARAVCRSAGGGRVYLANRTTEKARRLSEELGCACSDNLEIARSCKYIFLGVKPQGMGALLASLSPVLSQRQEPFVLISMAAGLTTRTIREMAGVPCPVVRLMPNTPCAVGAGVVLCCALDTPPDMLEEIQTMLAPAGLVDQVDEGLMDAGSALSGCGPAFVCLMLEGLADGAVACGLPRDKALSYAAQTLLGTARLALETKQHPAVLKDAVCSPAGSTIQGVRALEKAGFRSACMEAVIAAYEKTLAIGK